jgi:hypothetical protein
VQQKCGGVGEESLVINKIKILLLTKTSSKNQNSLGKNSIVVKEEEFVCGFGEREGKLQRERERDTNTKREEEEEEEEENQEEGNQEQGEEEQGEQEFGLLQGFFCA